MDFCEFEASLVYRVSSRTSKATQRNPVSKTKQNKNVHTHTHTTSNETIIKIGTQKSLQWGRV